VNRRIWEGAREKIDSHRLTAKGKALNKRRKDSIERSFPEGTPFFRSRL